MAGQSEPLREGKLMTAAELDFVLDELGLAQSELADLLCLSHRSVRRYLASEDTKTKKRIPMQVAILVRLIASGVVDVEAVRRAGDGVLP